MIDIVRTDSTNQDFINLVAELDSYLAVTDGDEHSFYDQFNKLDSINHVLIAYQDDKPVGCGAIKSYDSKSFEVKRMYVSPQLRGNGIASQILTKLEEWAIGLGATRCILETGIRQTAAVKLYHKKGYLQIENYGQYTNMENSVCFEKLLS